MPVKKRDSHLFRSDRAEKMAVPFLGAFPFAFLPLCLSLKRIELRPLCLSSLTQSLAIAGKA
jgi:hypothetical protein